MKKLFYFACTSLLALGAVSCDDDDDAPVRSLSATPENLTFTATPDAPKTIEVKAENVSWKATTEAGWLTLKNAEGTADGTITVEARNNTTTGPQNATIVIKAEGVDDVTVTVTQEAPGKSLSATPDNLAFTATPDVPKTIEVQAQNVSWEATTEAGWLELENATGTGNGTITVKASDNTTTDPQNATIVIKAEGVDDVTVTVTQEAGSPAITEPAIIWDRSSRSRMNLQGNVKTVSIFGNHLDDTFIYNLTFDDNGMLTSYDRMYGSTTVHFTLTYDGENRLTKIATSEFAIDLGYADHGKYVSTDNIFTNLSYSFNTDFKVWLPRFIKNLSSITAADAGYSTSIAINVSGDQGSIVYDGDEEGAMPIAFSGEFMSECKTEGYYATTETFTVNPENGNLLVHHIIDPFGAMDRKYNDDRINSIAELSGGDIQQKAIYNENLDMTRVEDIDDASKNFDIAYEYDEHQNWIKATYSGGSYDGEVLNRTVTY
ncbi:MAG: BACON domain-containing protein [Alistipes sp.]